MKNTVSFPNLGISVELNKIAFSVFGIDITWYAVIITFGIIIAMAISYINAKKINLHTDTFMDMFFYLLVFGIIGARIYYVAFNFDLYKNDLQSIFNIRQGGIAVYGAVIAGAIVILLYTKLKKQKFFDYTDCIVPALSLAQGIGRWGNFVNQEAYGYETNSLFAMSIYENGKLINVHPTFLCESVLNVFTFVVLTVFFNKFRKSPGEVSCLYAILYGIGRFFIEGMRTDSLYIGIFRISQIVSLILVISGVIIFIKIRSKREIEV